MKHEQKITQRHICCNLEALVVRDGESILDKKIEKYTCTHYGTARCQLHCDNKDWIDLDLCEYRL